MAKDKEFTEEMTDDYGPDYVYLTDDNGEEHEFEVADTLEYNDETYVGLLDTPHDDPNAYLQSDGSLFILKYDKNNDGMLMTVDDDDEFEEVSQIMMARLADLYDFEGEDEED